MEVSPGKMKSDAGSGAKAACRQPAFLKILHRGIFLRGAILAGLVAFLGLWAAAAAAQEERPQITPGEMKVGKKKNVGPRAVSVLEMTASGKKSLVPIAIRVNGQFFDASAYKADPIPMALDPGTVYEGERAGSSLGLFTVNSALHSTAVNSQTPWIATGSWIPAGSETPKAALTAETAPVGIDSTDQPPRLTRDPTKVVRTAAAPPGTPASSAPPTATKPSSGDEPPRLTKGVSPPPDSTTPASTGSASTAPGSTGPGATGPGATEPGSTAPSATAPKTPDDGKSSDAKSPDSKPDAAKPEVRASVPASDSGASVGNRPMLRRGTPVGALPDDDIPGYSKPGAKESGAAAGTPAAAAAKAAQAAADKLVDIVPAISDAGGPDPHSFAFEWLKDDEADRRKQVVQLATEQVRAYVEARAKALIAPTATSPAARRASSANPGSAKPASAKPGSAKPATKTAAKTPDAILENVQMKTYDLWTNNQPVIVFSAEAHLPPPAATSQADADAPLKYSILIVAYPDIYNNLHKVYVGVTDKYHLDLTPRLELIDAVDADGDGRGELLFREISDSGTGWVIYRATADKLWKMFDSLHPE
jgi:hypothetical protein